VVVLKSAILLGMSVLAAFSAGYSYDQLEILAAPGAAASPLIVLDPRRIAALALAVLTVSPAFAYLLLKERPYADATHR